MEKGRGCFEILVNDPCFSQVMFWNVLIKDWVWCDIILNGESGGGEGGGLNDKATAPFHKLYPYSLSLRNVCFLIFTQPLASMVFICSESGCPFPSCPCLACLFLACPCPSWPCSSCPYPPVRGVKLRTVWTGGIQGLG